MFVHTYYYYIHIFVTYYYMLYLWNLCYTYIHKDDDTAFEVAKSKVTGGYFTDPASSPGQGTPENRARSKW